MTNGLLIMTELTLSWDQRRWYMSLFYPTNQHLEMLITSYVCITTPLNFSSLKQQQTFIQLMSLQVNDLDCVQRGGFSGFCWTPSHGFRPCGWTLPRLELQLRQLSSPSCEANQGLCISWLQSSKRQHGSTRELLRPRTKTGTLSHFRIHKYSPADPVVFLGWSFSLVYSKFLSSINIYSKIY